MHSRSDSRQPGRMRSANGFWVESFYHCWQEGIGWSSASDIGGVTANMACPCLSSLDRDFFFVFPIRGGQLGREKRGNRWSVKVMSVMSQPRQRRGGLELGAFIPYSNSPAS